jgi:hypothetical protein
MQIRRSFCASSSLRPRPKYNQESTRQTAQLKTGLSALKDKTMNQPNANTPPQRREHLFSPHTGLCIYCGQNAQDDAIDNLPCGYNEPPPCEACGDKGWLLVESSDHGLCFERCDACQKFESDQVALEAVVKAAEA